MDPLLREFCRTPVAAMRHDFIARVQLHIQRVILEKLTRVEALEAENLALKADIDRLTEPKRGPGRPPKLQPVEAA